MKNLTKKSLIFTTTIAIIFAVVVTLYTKEQYLLVINIVFFLSLIVGSHLYIDMKLDKYAKEISKFDKFYDINDLGKDFEDVGQIYRNLLNKNIKLEKNIRSLKTRLEDLKNITSNMEEGFVVFDPKGEIELMNDASKNFLNRDEKTRIDKLIDDREYKLALREARILSKSKSLSLYVNNYHLKIYIDPIFDGNSIGFVVIIINYSETRKAELMRREFSANVSHELKSPLTSINGYAELIATGLAKEADTKKFAQIIYDEGNRLLDIIDDILIISRLDEGGIELKKTWVDISLEMERIVSKYKNLSDKKNIEVINRLPSYKIYTAETLFVDLLSNIYENAIKYNKIGGYIEINSLFIDDNLRIFIKDSGIGISNYDQKRIFERFYVADKARDRKQKSTGLGLSIVKHIGDLLGYEISLESSENEGSTFIVDIGVNDN